MGQCVSRKAAGAFAASAAATTHKKSTTMHKHNRFDESPECEDNKDNNPSRRPGSYTRGVAMSFGFKRRPVTAPSIADNATAARRLAKHEIIDRNGNGDTEPLTSNAIPPGRTTPRLAPPRKEANATRVSRFGFRQPNANRLNRVSDLNTAPPTQLEYRNNNRPNFKPATTLQYPRAKSAVITVDSNENKSARFAYATAAQVNRFTLQSTQLPKPQLPVRVIETKTAKTLANNCRKASRGMHPSEDGSSKEGSVTEDSGVGSHSSAGNGETDTLRGVELLDSSPTVGARRNHNYQPKPRQFEMVMSGTSFDLRDLDDFTEPSVPIPRLPSAFQNNYNNGFVRERRLEYEKQLEKSRRKISVTSSEGFSDEYVEEDRSAQRNRLNDSSLTPRSFLKSKPKQGSTPPSSDEQEWMHAGEAMAEDFSYSFSSSDESKGRESLVTPKLAVKPASLTLQNLMNASMTNYAPPPNREIKNVLLTIEDPKFAAVAAASNMGTLLEDETSPVDSLICSYSESEDFIKHKLLNNDIKKTTMIMSSSDSKDINEKLTLSPSSPGTPTNASNSLSLSDGKDYFDDEIADQPALVFDDTITTNISEPISVTQQTSENTPTLIDSTPKPKRKFLGGFEGSPLLLRKKNLLNSRTASVDTLSPCESITSEDLMLDYEQSQSSGLDDTLDRFDRQNNGFNSLDDTTLRLEENKATDSLREWARPVGNHSDIGSPKSMARSSRLLRSRASTPSSVPDSPCSLDSRLNSTKSHSVTRSPMRPPRPSLGSPAGYESDDSIKIDRASHGAMVQDIVQMKTMLIKLKRVLNEQADEDYLKKSETLNPFENQPNLKNGLFNGLSSEGTSTENLSLDDGGSSRMEMAELRRQVLFLQGQLEDREQSLQVLQDRMHKLVTDTEMAKSAPASTVSLEVSTANAATQTERVRPISAGPSLLQVSPTDGNMGSLVSASENSRRSRPPSLVDTPPLQLSNSNSSRKSLPKLWRKPGEPPSPQRYGSNTLPSSIPRRANSRTRAPSTPS